jgi:hypothetical protein
MVRIEANTKQWLLGQRYSCGCRNGQTGDENARASTRVEREKILHVLTTSLTRTSVLS